MSIYDHSINTLEGEPADLTEYQGKPVLMVNVASKCGLTPQYEGLERIHERFADKGFSVLGFPCNQFLEQEPGSSDEIRQFCSMTYGITFPLFEKVEVNGDARHALYTDLVQVADGDGEAGDVQWNFEKFLVGRDGSITRFRPTVEPESDELIGAIEAAIDG